MKQPCSLAGAPWSSPAAPSPFKLGSGEMLGEQQAMLLERGAELRPRQCPPPPAHRLRRTNHARPSLCAGNLQDQSHQAGLPRDPPSPPKLCSNRVGHLTWLFQALGTATSRRSFGAQWAKDLASPLWLARQLWRGFDPGPGFPCTTGAATKKNLRNRNFLGLEKSPFVVTRMTGWQYLVSLYISLPGLFPS